MKSWIIFIALMSQTGMAARIVNAAWDSKQQSLIVQIAYQGGCLDHQFSISWGECADDGSRLGLILDSGSVDTCSNEESQIFVSNEPTDGCLATSFVLKSSSSKVPFIISK